MYWCARLAGVTAARAARPHHRAPSGAGSRGVPFSAPACRGRSGAGARGGGARGSARSAFFFRGARRAAGAMAAPGAAHMQAKLVRGAGGARGRVAGAGRRAPAGTKGTPLPSKNKRRFCFALPRAPPRARAGVPQATSGTHSPRMTVSARLVRRAVTARCRSGAGGAGRSAASVRSPFLSAFPFLRCASAARSRRARRAHEAPVTTICSAA